MLCLREQGSEGGGIDTRGADNEVQRLARSFNLLNCNQICIFSEKRLFFSPPVEDIKKISVAPFICTEWGGLVVADCEECVYVCVGVSCNSNYIV